MLQDVADIVARVGALLDDPTNSTFTSAYLIPFIDQKYEELDDQLEKMGMQNVEGIAVFNVNPAVSDLTPFSAGTGPLSSMKLPKFVQWKLVGQLDVDYQPSERVDRLDDFDLSSYGAQQWKFTDDNLQVTPSAVAMTLRVYYDALSTNIINPAQNVVMGTAHILASRVAAKVATVRGNKALGDDNAKDAYSAWNTFCTILNMAAQGKPLHVKSLHRRRFSGTPFISALNSGT